MPKGGEISITPWLLAQFGGQQMKMDRGNVKVTERTHATLFGLEAEMNGKTFKVRTHILISVVLGWDSTDLLPFTVSLVIHSADEQRDRERVQVPQGRDPMAPGEEAPSAPL